MVDEPIENRHFDNFQQYKEYIFNNLSQFDRTFKPYKKWEHVKLSDIEPCHNCEIQKERINNRHLHMLSSGSGAELVEKCRQCADVNLWRIDCAEKLEWYEDRDEKLNSELED